MPWRHHSIEGSLLHERYIRVPRRDRAGETDHDEKQNECPLQARKRNTRQSGTGDKASASASYYHHYIPFNGNTYQPAGGRNRHGCACVDSSAAFGSGSAESHSRANDNAGPAYRRLATTRQPSFPARGREWCNRAFEWGDARAGSASHGHNRSCACPTPAASRLRRCGHAPGKPSPGNGSAARNAFALIRRRSPGCSSPRRRSS